ncbi:histidine phosphatase family protein [Streptomyces sp. NPDC096012]|uniref:histidine phosphatase family protein n=1 Tax=Streptomyces sp. NPDC096012 TaxID=3155684 RepID=UPI00336A64EF
MTIRLTLLCAHPEGTSADTVFGCPPPGERGLPGAGVVPIVLPPPSLTVGSPSRASTQTAAALALHATVEPALRDLDYGTWRGRTVADVVATDPFGYSAWLRDPDAAPHGGETVRQLCRRAAHWLDGLPPDTGRTLAITEPAVVRALLVHAMSAPARAFWKLPLRSPLSTVCLTRSGGAWSVHPAEAASDRGSGRHTSVLIPAPAASRRLAADAKARRRGEKTV